MDHERRHQPLRILFVDDEPAIGSCFRALVESGCRAVVTVCYDPKCALQKLEKEQFDLLITDIVMPGGMDGLRLADIVAESYHIPVVLITGFTPDDVMPLGFDPTKAVCCLSKPYTLREVEEKVREAMHLKQVASAREYEKQSEERTESD